MADIEVREVTRTTGETSPTGNFTREDTVYEVGALIDGTFVRFATIDQGHVDVAKAREEAENEKNPPAEQPAEPQPAQPAEGSTTPPPDENTAVSEASTAEQPKQ